MSFKHFAIQDERGNLIGIFKRDTPDKMIISIKKAIAVDLDAEAINDFLEMSFHDDWQLPRSVRITFEGHAFEYNICPAWEY